MSVGRSAGCLVLSVGRSVDLSVCHRTGSFTSVLLSEYLFTFDDHVFYLVYTEEIATFSLYLSFFQLKDFYFI